MEIPHSKEKKMKDKMMIVTIREKIKRVQFKRRKRIASRVGFFRKSRISSPRKTLIRHLK